MTTGKTIALTRWTFVGKVMSLLFNMLSRLVITFLPRSKRLLISSSPSRPPARLREGRGPGTRRPWGQGGPARPHSPLLLPVAGSSLSRRGHEEATVDRLSRSATACRGSRAHCYPFRCRSRGCGEAEQRWGDGRQEGGKEWEKEGGRSGKGGEGRGHCGVEESSVTGHLLRGKV